MALTDRSQLRELLSRHGFTLSKAMGQNFLVNPSVCPRMAEAGGAAPGVGVLEIGPGIGVLTEALAQRADRVVSVELDERLRPLLAETMQLYPNVEIVWGDVLKLDLEAILAQRTDVSRWVVCANLPYYITTPILMRILESRLPVEAVTVMVQKEAAARLCAAPGERACGAISAAVSYYSQPSRLFSVAPGSFVPPPKVESQVIRLDVLRQPSVSPADEAAMFAVVRGAFSQRRKTILNALSAALGRPKDSLLAAFSAAEVNPGARAEQLTLRDFAALSDALGA